jgi:TetR/AcrR family tetracycline transcriptional repressor
VARSPEPEPSRLSRERIVEAAFGLLEREGWEALSMRRLAQELDVWPMAVYRYFRDKEELVDAVLGSVVETMELPRVSGSWRDRLSELLGSARRTLEPLPPELRTRLAPQLAAPGALPVSEAGIGAMKSAGFTRAEAARAWEALAAYAVGSLSCRPGRSQRDRRQFEYGLDRLLDGLERGALEPGESDPAALVRSARAG